MVSGTWTLGGAQHSTYCCEDEDRWGGNIQHDHGDVDADGYGDDNQGAGPNIQPMMARMRIKGSQHSTYKDVDDDGYGDDNQGPTFNLLLVKGSGHIMGIIKITTSPF